MTAPTREARAVEKSAHTATPWRREYDDNGFFFVDAMMRPSPYIVATGGEGDEDLANADLIVRAVNAHDDLVKALEDFVRFTRNANTLSTRGAEIEIARLCSNADAALAKAGGAS